MSFGGVHDHCRRLVDRHQVIVFEEDVPMRVPTYRREALRAGHVIAGPGVVDQLDTTTLILPGQRCEIDEGGNFILTEEGDRP